MQRANRSLSRKNFVTLVLTVALVGYLLSQVDQPQKLWAIFNIPFPVLLLTFLIYLLTYVVRALRWKFLLIANGLSLTKLLAVSSIHILYNNLLPARMGELTYPYLLEKKLGIPTDKGVATLVIARIFDLLSITTIFLLAITFSPTGTAHHFSGSALLSTTVIACLVLVLIFLPNIMSVAFRSLEKISHVKSSIKSKWINKLAKRVSEIQNYIERIQRPAIYLPAFALSFVHWTLTFAICYLVIASINEGSGNQTNAISIGQVVLGASGAELSTVLPIHGLAGFGTFEGFWTTMFVSIGMDKQLAILTGFAYHILFLAYSIILGVTSFLATSLKQNVPFANHACSDLVLRS